MPKIAHKITPKCALFHIKIFSDLITDCPMLLMQTTKTAVCLQRKAIFHHLYGF